MDDCVFMKRELIDNQEPGALLYATHTLSGIHHLILCTTIPLPTRPQWPPASARGYSSPRRSTAGAFFVFDQPVSTVTQHNIPPLRVHPTRLNTTHTFIIQLRLPLVRRHPPPPAPPLGGARLVIRRLAAPRPPPRAVRWPHVWVGCVHIWGDLRSRMAICVSVGLRLVHTYTYVCHRCGRRLVSSSTRLPPSHFTRQDARELRLVVRVLGCAMRHLHLRVGGGIEAEAKRKGNVNGCLWNVKRQTRRV